MAREQAPGAGPPLLAGSEIDYPPYSVVAADGRADGFSVELLRAAARAVDREITFRTGIWDELKRDLAEGRLQVLPLVARSPPREAVYDFTFPYLTMHGTVVVRSENADVHGIDDLGGKDVAVLQGDYAHEYLVHAQPGARVVRLPSFATALRELSAGRHDAVVIQRLLALQLMKSARIENLKTVGRPLEGYSQSFCFAVRKGNGALLASLNEGLAIAIADGTFRNLHAKWFGPLEELGRTRSRVVVGGEGDYPPYEFLDRNGQPAGFYVDLTRAVARQVGIDVEIRLGPWAKTRKELESGDIDLMQGMFYSVERDRTYVFSPPHTVVAHAIAARKGAPVPADLASLAGKSILVRAGSIMEDLAIEVGLGRQLVPVTSGEEALTLLAAGRNDCALVARVPALFWIEKHGWRNLELSGKPILSAEAGFATAHTNADLLSRMSDGLAALEASGELRKIRSRWLAPYEPPRASPRAVAGYLLAVVLPLLALLFGTVLWSRSLKRQVLERTRELSAKSALVEEQSAEVRKLNAELESRVLSRTAELAAALREMESFSYSVAHDLRAPVRAIDGYTALLQKASGGAIDEEGRRLLAAVRSNSLRMGRLIDDLLAFSRTSRTRMAVEPIDMGRLAREVAADQAEAAARAGVEIRVLELPAASGDPALLRVVFGNLVSNGVKFSAGRPGAVVEVGARGGERGVEYFVRDNGVGFDPRYSSKLFGVFQRLHGMGEFEGTGIGLALVKRIVERHGGWVRAEGEPDRGATFSFGLARA